MAKKEFQSTFRELTYAGYGLVFISHSTEKTYKNEKGEEYQQIVPALPTRPFDIVNKMVDIIAYIREIPVEQNNEIVRKRFMFLRGDERFLAKSRYRYIAPKVELDYDSLVNAIYDAIDEEVKHSGGESSDDINPYSVKSYNELIEEAKTLWVNINKVNKAEAALGILEQVFGKPTRFSEITPEQTEQFSLALRQISDLIE